MKNLSRSCISDIESSGKSVGFRKKAEKNQAENEALNPPDSAVLC